MRARALFAALALQLLIAPLAAQQAAEPESVEAPQLPPQAPQRERIDEVPLPVEPPKPSPAPIVEKPKPTPPPPLPPVVEKPKAAPSIEPAKPQAECEIKPVMTDDELRACGVRR